MLYTFLKPRSADRNQFFTRCRLAVSHRTRRIRELLLPKLQPLPALASFSCLESLEARIAPAVVVSLTGTNVTFSGDGADDHLFLRLNQNGAIEFSTDGLAFSSDLGGGATLAMASTTKISVDLAGGSDTLSVLNDGGFVGNALPGFQIAYDGGGGGDDTLILSGVGAHPIASHSYTMGATRGAGTIATVEAISGNVQPIVFVNLTPVIDLVPAASLVVTGTNADNAINYSKGQNSGIVNGSNPAGVATGQVSVDGFEAIEFANKTTLSISGLAGNDTINLNNPGTPAGLTQINVDGGDPTASGDTLLINGSVGSDTIGYTITNATSSSITGAGPVPIAATNFGAVNLDGQNGSSGAIDGLTVTTVSGFDTVTLTPGNAFDAGSVRVASTAGSPFSAIPINFSGLGAIGSSLTFKDGAASRTDTLIYNGTDASNDTFRVAATSGDITLNGQIVVHTPGVHDLVLSGLNGDDTFNVTGAQPYTTITLAGGNPSTSDIANVTGDGTNVVANLGGPVASLTGGGLGTVFLPGVEILNLNAVAGAINVMGTTGPDAFHVTPAAANTATLRAEAFGPVVNTTNTGSLNFVEGTANDADTITVHGSSMDDSIAITRGAQTIVQTNSWKAVTITTGLAEAIVVSAGLGNDTIAISGVDGSAHAPLYIDGGSQTGDALTINVPTGTTTAAPGATPDSGTVSAPQNANVAFSAIGSLAINGANPLSDTLVIQGTQGSDHIAAASVGGAASVFVNDRAVTKFTSFFALNLDGRFGDDTFSISPAGLPLNSINVTGGDPTASDTLLVNGTAASDVIAFTPIAADAGSVAIAGQPTVNFNTTEFVEINGSGGGDALTITTPAGAQQIDYGAGPTDDAGSVRIASLVGMSFQQLGTGGSITLADISGTRVDALTFNGSDANDTFAVAAGSVGLNGGIAPALPGVADLTLNGLGGDDTFNISPNPFTTITVAGGDPSASDIANVTGDGTNVVANLGAPIASVTGGGLGNVFLPDIEILNLNAIAGNISINGTSGPDAFHVTPTGAGTATIQIGNQSPVLNTTNTGTLTIDPLGGVDAVTIFGDVAANTVNIALGATTTIGIDAKKTIGVTSANAELLTVSTLEGNDSITVSGTGGAPLSIDAGAGDDVVNASAVTVDGLTIHGGEGNDTITGGAGADSIFGGDGNDVVIGGRGNDQFFGGGGSDTFIWNPGDGSDLVEGDAGNNVLIFNGSAAAEVFTLSANGTRATLTRDVGAVTMDLAGIQQIDLSAGAGADTVAINDLFITDVRVLNVHLGSDGDADKISVAGTDAADFLTIASTAPGAISVQGFSHFAVQLTSLTTSDTLMVKGNAGDDVLRAESGVENVAAIVLDGGTGNDLLDGTGTLLGGSGNDTLIVGNSFSTLDGGAGDDTFVLGSANYTVDGGTGFDSVQISGTPLNDAIDITQPNPSVLASTINGAAQALAISSIEQARVDAGAGDDIIRITQSDSLVSTPAASLPFTIEGGASSAGDRLVVVDDGIGDTMLQWQGQDISAGSISIGPLAPINYSGIEFAQPISGGTDLNGRLVVFKHDALENNDSASAATHLGAAAALNAAATIAPDADTLFLAPADADYYRVQALTSGILDFHVFFTKVGTLANGRPGLPGQGNLRFDVLDQNGNIKASGVPVSDGLDVKLPAVQGQVFFLKVAGATSAAINPYSVTVTDSPLPVFANGSLGGNSSFIPTINYPAGRTPSALATGDLNGDGFADIVVANSRSNTVSVRLGNGNGTFGAETIFPSGGRTPSALALADLNHDGSLDLIVANKLSTEVVVEWGNGMGGFGPITHLALGKNRQPVAVEVGDVNGDTNPDLVTANPRTGDVSVLIGDGAGNFSPATNFKTGGRNPSDLALADFNHDSDLDIVAVNTLSNDVSLLQGDGLGAFSTANKFKVGSRSVSIAAADFNEDGHIDIAVANASSTFQSILLGAGAGGALAFHPQIQASYTRGAIPSTIAVGDFNLDGHTDIVLSNLRGKAISVLIGNANGTFSKPIDFATSGSASRQPVSLAIADLNKDGFADILVANARTNDVSILLRTITP